MASQNHDDNATENNTTTPTPDVNASRRKFLQGAAVAAATATAAGVAAAAAAGASHQDVKHAIQSFGVVSNITSDPTACSMCIENSGFTQISTVNSSATEFIWFTATNLPADSYTLTYTLNGSPFDPTSTSSTPFKLTSSGNNAFLFQNTGSGTPSTCPNANPANQINQGHTLDDISPTANTGTKSDLQFKLHVRYDGSYPSGTLLTFVGTLKNSSGTTVCTATISITVN